MSHDIVVPSLANGYASRASSWYPWAKYPQLWKSCVFAFSPFLGVTGKTLIDYSGLGQHADVLNADSAMWAFEDGYYSLLLDGSNDYIRAPVTDRLTQAFNGPYTVTMWIKCSSGGTVHRLWRYSNGTTGLHSVIFNYTSNGKCLFYCGNGGLDGDALLSTTSSLSDGKRHHLAFTASDGTSTATARIYVDGVQDNSRTRPLIGSLTASDLVIGSRDPTDGTQHFPGNLNDFMVFGRELTVSEIRLLASHPGVAFDLDWPALFRVQAAAATGNPWYQYLQQHLLAGAA